MSNSKPNVWARRRSRRALVQAVYQWQVSKNSVPSIKKDFAESEALKKADTEFFDEIFTLITQQAAALDDAFAPLLDRSIDQLDVIEHAVLRLAAAEFTHRIDVPYRVVIDEYVELTKVFGAQDAYKYVNGVLDKLAASLREIEVQAAGRSSDS